MSVRGIQLTGRRRLVAIALSVAVLLAVGATSAALLFSTRTAHGSGTGGGGCISTTGGPACTFKNGAGFADFSNVSSDGCVFTDAQVSIFDSLTMPGHTSTQSVFVYISKWDACNDVSLEQAGSFDPNTGFSTFSGAIQLSSDLSGAKVTGTAVMYDWASGGQQFTTNLDLTFKGYGPTSKFADNQHFRAPGYIINNHSTGTSRSAEVSGTLTDQDGSNIASATTYASLDFSTGGTVQIFRY